MSIKIVRYIGKWRTIFIKFNSYLYHWVKKSKVTRLNFIVKLIINELPLVARHKYPPLNTTPNNFRNVIMYSMEFKQNKFRMVRQI